MLDHADFGPLVRPKASGVLTETRKTSRCSLQLRVIMSYHELYGYLMMLLKVFRSNSRLVSFGPWPMAPFRRVPGRSSGSQAECPAPRALVLRS